MMKNKKNLLFLGFVMVMMTSYFCIVEGKRSRAKSAIQSPKKLRKQAGHRVLKVPVQEVIAKKEEAVNSVDDDNTESRSKEESISSDEADTLEHSHPLKTLPKTSYHSEHNSEIETVEKLIEKLHVWKHHNYAEMTWFLTYYNTSCFNMSYMYSIGTSVQNRELWVMALGATPEKHVPGTPEVKLIGNVHGNEATGRELLLYTIKYFCENAMSDKSINSLLSKVRLHIMPSLNPDGYEMASTRGMGDKFIGRLNANGADINRNFPDQFFSSYHDTEPETLSVIKWMQEIPFVVSASFHDRAMVVSYPYDDSPSGQTKYSATPDDDVFRRMALVYSENHPVIHQGNTDNCTNSQQKRFVGGVTNGAEWSSLTNTMQDYNYAYTNCFEITVSLRCESHFVPTDVPGIFNDNLNSIKELVKQSLRGIKGFVYSDDGVPMEGVKISVGDRKHDVKTARDGDYWRILLPGSYQITASKKGYTKVEILVTVDLEESKTLNFTLSKKPVDMAVLTLGHMNKISNIMSYEWDGRDSDDSILSSSRDVKDTADSNQKELEDKFSKSLSSGIHSTSSIQTIDKVKIKNQPFLQPILSGVKPDDREGPPSYRLDEISNQTVNHRIATTPFIEPLKGPLADSYNKTSKNKEVGTNTVGIGSVVDCTISGKPKDISGTLKWTGKIKKLAKSPSQEPPLIYGLELFSDDPLATNGTFLKEQYFYSPQNRAYFVPARLCRRKQIS